jgi:hypothetical protein
MNSRPERGREPGIAGHYKGEAPRPAYTSEIPPQRLAVRLAVMTQHHAGQSTRQSRRSRARIRQPARVCEQPELRQASGGAGPPGSRPRPGEQASIHVSALPS